MKSRRYLFPVMLGVLLSQPTSAQTTQLDSHVHGIARLNLVVTESEVLAEFESPAINLVGFEHRAHSEQDKRQLATTLERLRQAEKFIFLPQQSGCKLNAAQVESTHSKSDDHGHGDDHGDEHDDEHDDEQSTHSEIHAEYRFECRPGNPIKTIGIGLITEFPGIEKINYQLVSRSGQTGGQVTADQTEITVPR